VTRCSLSGLIRSSLSLTLNCIHDFTHIVRKQFGRLQLFLIILTVSSFLVITVEIDSGDIFSTNTFSILMPYITDCIASLVKWQGVFDLSRVLMPVVKERNNKEIECIFGLYPLILLTWRIWWAPNNASKWQMGFNSAFKGLIKVTFMNTQDTFLLFSCFTNLFQLPRICHRTKGLSFFLS